MNDNYLKIGKRFEFSGAQATGMVMMILSVYGIVCFLIGYFVGIC